MEETKKEFKLSKTNWILALTVIGLNALFLLRRDGLDPFNIGYILGTIMMVGLFPLAYALIVWYIRGKKMYAGTYTFNVIVVMLCIGMFKEIGFQSKERNEGFETITNSASELKEKIISDEDILPAYEEHISNVDDGLSKLIRNSSGDNKKVYKNLKKFSEINSSILIAWQIAQDSVLAPRILDYSILNTHKECSYQIEVLNHFIEQSKLYKNHLQNRISIFKDLNKDIAQNNKTFKNLLAGLNKKDSIQQPVLQPYLDSHIEYGKNLVEIITFLQAEIGNWEFKNDDLHFDDSELENRYIGFITKTVALEIDINEMTDKVIEVM